MPTLSIPTINVVRVDSPPAEPKPSKRRKMSSSSSEDPPASVDPMNRSMVVTEETASESAFLKVLDKITLRERSNSGMSFQGDPIDDEAEQQYQHTRLLDDIPKIDKLTEFLELEMELGSGSFGKVYRAKLTHKWEVVDADPGDKLALKVLGLEDERSSKDLAGELDEGTSISESDEEKPMSPDFKKITNAQQEFLHEYEVLKRLKDAHPNHPNILQLKGAALGKHKPGFYLMTELCSGPPVFDQIIYGKFLCESVVREIVKQILIAVEFCHSNRIAHRDLKPENLLFSTRLEHLKDVKSIPSVKLIDFGCALIITDSTMTYEMAGTPWYIAPEVIFAPIRRPSVILATKTFRSAKKKMPTGKNILACDMWSLGVIVFLMLTGRFPFQEKSREGLYAVICKGAYEFTPEEQKKISPSARSFVAALLCLDWEQRLSAHAALQHEWITGESNQEHDHRPYDEKYFESLKTNQVESKRRMKAAINSIIFSNRMNKRVPHTEE